MRTELEISVSGDDENVEKFIEKIAHLIGQAARDENVSVAIK